MTNKKGLLPIVREEIGFALHAEVSQTPNNQYMLELLQRLQLEDNPCVAQYLNNLMLFTAKTLSEREAVLYAGLGVYRLLESQAEADRMNREL